MSWAEKLKSREFVELAILYGLVLITEWTVNPVNQILFWVTLAWVVATTIRARQSARNLGLRPANLRQSVWVAAAALAFAAVAVWIAAERHTLHDFEFTMLAGWRFWGYAVWTFVQEFLLQDYFLFRLLRLLPNKRMAIVTAALLFAGAHIPNPLLMVATLVWGILACVLFLRYRDLYSLGLAQGVLGICIAVTIPGALHHQMHVGRGYYDYRHPRLLNHWKVWGERWDLNPRPSVPQTDALPTELRSPSSKQTTYSIL
jgi:hypothetical protein